LNKERWTEITTTGDTKPKSSNYSKGVLFRDKMYIFGGYPKSDNLCALDLQLYTWISIELKGSIPSPRDSHTFNMMEIVKSTSEIQVVMILCGGYDANSRQMNDIYEFDMGIWRNEKYDDFRSQLRDNWKLSDVNIHVLVNQE